MKTKRIIAAALGLMIILTATGCAGGKKSEEKTLEGSATEILNTVYENADFGQDMKDSLEFYDTVEFTQEESANFLGDTDVKFSEAVYSAPRMSSVAYQCILLRLADGEDVDAAKEAIKAQADPRKWICVEAENVVVENVGNVILFCMGGEEALAVKDAFLALGE